MKPLRHAQVSAATYGGSWTDYIEAHSFLDSSKATCAHFKHRFLLHHAEGIELGVRIFGEMIRNGEDRAILTKKVLTEHLIEDVGRIVSVEDWAHGLLPDSNSSFYNLLAKKREQIEANATRSELDLSECFIDRTFISAKKGRTSWKTKRGKGTKIMAMADRAGFPLAGSRILLRCYARPACRKNSCRSCYRTIA